MISRGHPLDVLSTLLLALACASRAHADCLMGGWSDWTPCTHSCGGGGRHTRTRAVFRQGVPCTFARVQISNCGAPRCPVDCQLGAWGPWGRCSHTCGPLARHTRARPIVSRARFGGARCPCAVASTGADVKGGACGKVNVNVNANGPATTIRQTRACALRDCPLDCVLAQWGGWTSCSSPCGSAGSQTLARKVALPLSSSMGFCDR